VSELTDDIKQAEAETLPRIREEAGLPPVEEDDEGGYDEERVRYVELLESALVGKQAAILMMRKMRR
jgi:hypothetical protein